jgi:hypothetical protein
MMDGIDMLQARIPAEPEAPVSAKPPAPVAAEQGPSCGMRSGSGSSVQGWVAKHRGWVVISSIAVAGTGVALGEGWMTVAGLAPLLYVAPCAVMMMFCMKGMSGGTQTAQNQSSSPVTPAAANDPQK